MMQKDLYILTFAGIFIKFILPTAVSISEEVIPFLCEDEREADVVFEVRLLTKALVLNEKPLVSYRGMQVYSYNKAWLRVYPLLIAEDGCQVACIDVPERKHILYYPASAWDVYAKNFRCMHLIGIESLLLQYDALLLHSSLVQIHGQTILFSGPSGIGKSTQASLWQKYLDADILNGDRCIVRKMENVFYGCGSPWAGTSGIYRPEYAPIKGIFLLRQAEENSLCQIKKEAFTRIFNQCIVNTWDYNYVMGLTDLIVELLEKIPVYELSCRPDEEAVRLAYDALFKGRT